MLRLGLTTLETALLISIIAVGAAIVLSALSSTNLNVAKQQKGLAEVLYVFKQCKYADEVRQLLSRIYHVKSFKTITLTDGCKSCIEKLIVIRVIASGTLSAFRVVGAKGAELITPKSPLALSPGYYLLCVKYKQSLGEMVIRELKIPGFTTVIVLSPRGPLVYK